MATETPQIYNEKILTYASIYGLTAEDVASTLGLPSSIPILGSILEEANDRNESWVDYGKQFVGDALAARNLLLDSHQEIVAQYNQLAAMTPEERADITGLAKRDYPLMIDVGVGNVQSYTAIRLLNDYNNTYPSSDPLGLKKYNGNYRQLVDDLLDKMSPTAVKFAGLMVKEAFDWGQAHIANWNSLSADEKDAFTVFYYNIGQDEANRRYQEAVDTVGSYVVNISATPISQEYLLNLANITDYSTPSNSGWLGIANLISQDYYADFTLENNQCFLAGTPITMWPTDPNLKPGPDGVYDKAQVLAGLWTKPIEQVSPKDLVLAYDDKGNMVPGDVDKLFTNTTPEWILLDVADGRDRIHTTPGHRFLTEMGDYMEIGHMLRLGGGTVRLVDMDGSIVEATGEVVAYSVETAHLFEEAQTKTIAMAGNTVLKEQVETGWQTYNFEVREHHNYVAEGIRVHNDSILSTLQEGDQLIALSDDLRDAVILRDVDGDGAQDIVLLDGTAGFDGDTVIVGTYRVIYGESINIPFVGNFDLAEELLALVADTPSLASTPDAILALLDDIVPGVSFLSFFNDDAGFFTGDQFSSDGFDFDGTSGSDVLEGLDGDDTINGLEGADTINGGDGNDTIRGGDGADSLFGGDGDDFIRGGDGNDSVDGGNGNDTVLGAQDADILWGRNGNDVINANGGNDQLRGGGGNDTLNGGGGDDRLWGHTGNDRLVGSSGADQFIFAGNFGNDTITDFDETLSGEVINLSGVGSITSYNDLMNNHVTQTGNHVFIDAGNGNTIRLFNVNISDLSSDDFLF